MSNGLAVEARAVSAPVLRQSGEGIKAVRTVDLRKEFCPMTFVKFKLHLDQIAPGEILEVLLKPGEHMQNMPRNIQDQGHQIVAVAKEGDCYHLLVQKKG